MIKIQRVDNPQIMTQSEWIQKGYSFYHLASCNPYPYIVENAYIVVDTEFHKTDLGDGDIQESICNGYTYLFEYNGEFMIKPLRQFEDKTQYVISFSEDFEDNISINKNDLLIWGRVVAHFVEC